MALTLSSMMNLGTLAPDFFLIDSLDNNKKNLSDLKGEKASLIMFICNHCPYVIHVMPELKKINEDFKNKGLNLIAISSNDAIAYPADSPELMPDFSKKYFNHHLKLKSSLNNVISLVINPCRWLRLQDLLWA